jgi:hypothetical protein
MTKNRFLFITLLVLCGNTLLAQVPAWGGGADQQDFSFGFTFQYLSPGYKIVKKPDWRSPYFDPEANKNITDSLSSIYSKRSQGFAVGFISRYSLSDHIEVRSTPSLVFSDRSLSYTYNTPTQNVDKQIQSTMVDVPLLIKLKSDRISNFRLYVVGGIKYSMEIGFKKKNNDANAAPLDKAVKNIKNFASYEAGLGCDIYFEFFKLSPELKLANSFGNVLVAENHPFSKPIDKLFLHNLMFSLYFE